MRQITDFNFVAKETFINGSYKLHFIECEVYRTLFILGYRFVRIDKKPFLYQINALSKIRIIKNIQGFRDAFATYIKQLDLPEKDTDEILNIFYSKPPIKRNGLFEHYLTDSKEPGSFIIQEIEKQSKKE